MIRKHGTPLSDFQVGDRIRIFITPIRTWKGQRGHSMYCPLSLAFKAAFPDAQVWTFDNTKVYANGRVYSFKNSRATRWAHRFDEQGYWGVNNKTNFTYTLEAIV